jgi:hypothetical protein
MTGVKKATLRSRILRIKIKRNFYVSGIPETWREILVDYNKQEPFDLAQGERTRQILFVVRI